MFAVLAGAGWAGDPRTEAQNVELSAHQFHSTPPEAHTQHGHSDSDDDNHSDSDSKLKSALRRRLQHKAIEQNICPAEADLQVLMLYVSQSVLHVQIAVRLRRTYVLKHILVFDV